MSNLGWQDAGMQERVYPTDLNDEQWEAIQPVMPTGKDRGRPRVDLRKVMNALLYMARAGCSWRMLPKDFGPWQTVCGYFRRWCKQGRWLLINHTLAILVRKGAGKRPRPTAAVLDSQTVRSADHAGERGFDGAKLTKGRKRHVLVDTLGLLLWVFVTPADVGERAGAMGFLPKALSWFGWLRCIWADQGYGGKDFAAWVASHRKTGTLRLEIVSKIHPRRFSILPKRWIVERTFGWLVKNRRLVRDYEITTDSAEGWIYVSMIGLMLRRLA
jgi:putative transposase